MAEIFVTGNRYYYSQLPQHMKPIYAGIFNGLNAHKPDYSFPVQKHNGVYPNNDVLIQVLKFVLNDNPALYHVDATNVLVYAPQGLSNKARITYTEYYNPARRAEIERELYRRTYPILEFLRTKRAGYSQVYDIYRYLLATMTYNYDISRTDTLQNLESRTIVGPLINKFCVCAGYTKAFKLLCDQLGIGCFYINGTAKGNNGWVNHGWNVVYLDGNFYHVDVTFDSTTYHNTGEYTFEYFLRGDQKMLADHKWDRNKFPVMVSDYSQI